MGRKDDQDYGKKTAPSWPNKMTNKVKQNITTQPKHHMARDSHEQITLKKIFNQKALHHMTRDSQDNLTCMSRRNQDSMG